MWPPRTAEYERQVNAQGKIFIAQLPANTSLGPRVRGAPGARTLTPSESGGRVKPLPGASARPVYELAPVAVQGEMAWLAVTEAPSITEKAAVALDEVMTPIIEATGLDHGMFGVLAKVTGIPLSVLVLLLVLVAYAVLRQYGVVPPLKKVIE